MVDDPFAYLKQVRYHSLSSRAWKLKKAMEYIEYYEARIPLETTVYTWRYHRMTKATWADVSRYVRFAPTMRTSFLVTLAQGQVYWLDPDTASALDIRKLPAYDGNITYCGEYA